MGKIHKAKCLSKLIFIFYIILLSMVAFGSVDTSSLSFSEGLRIIRGIGGPLNRILNDARAKKDLELAQRAYGSLFRILAQDCQGDPSDILTILNEKGFDVTEEDVLADFVKGILPAQDLLAQAQEVISSIMESMGFTVPEGAKVVKDSRGSYRGIPYASSLVPKSSEDQHITSLDEAVSIALALGKKAIIVKNRAQMYVLAAAVQIELAKRYIQTFNRSYNVGIATGGTTEVMRMLMGMPEYLREYLDEAPNYDLLNYVATLDDYNWTPGNLAKAITEIGPRNIFPYTYRDEQWNLWLKYILGDEEYFISPGIGYANSQEAVSIFHKELEKFVFLFQVWGVGSDGHCGFNEPGYDPLSSDQVVRLKDITRIQNVFAFLKPEGARPLSVFRDFAAEFRVYELDELKRKMQEELKNPGVPKGLEHRKDEWEKLREDFNKHWDYMVNMVSRIPKNALTQGSGDNLSRSLFHIILVDKPHKAVPLSLALEGDISSEATVSAIQLAINSIWIIEESAARYLKNTDNYFYLDLPESVWQPFTDDNIKIAFVKRYIEEIGLDKNTAYKVAIRLNITLEEAEELISKVK